MIKEGGVGSIYAGIDASIMRQAIYGTARIGLHRTFSDMIEEKMAGNVPFWMKTASGMASGAIAVCIGTPMDVALVRMQSDSMKPEAERRHYKHVIDAMSRTAQEEGIGALWKGLYPNIGRGMAMNVGMLACYDQAKEVSSDRRNMARDDGRATTWPLPPPGPTRAVRPRPSSRTLPKPFLWLRSPRA
jgi:solute carrier family 25 oxoglutarate transporter 11